eukprot:jgi/Mesvir1/20413/Mv12317-RA.1
MRVTNEIAQFLDSLTLVMDGALINSEFPERVADMFKRHNISTPSVHISDAFIEKISKTFLSGLLIPEFMNRAVVDAVLSAPIAPPFSGVAGISIAPIQWDQLLTAVCSSLGRPKILSAHGYVRSDELEQLGRRIITCCITPSTLNSAKLRVSLATCVSEFGVDQIVVCCLLQLSSLSQAGTTLRSLHEEIVEEIMVAARAAYMELSNPAPVDTMVTKAINDFVLTADEYLV